MKFDVICFGSATIDVFVNTDLREKDNLVSYPVGSKILIKNLKFDIGGGGTNTATAFSRLGFKTGYLGKIGSDNNGKEILKLLRKEGIVFLGKIGKELTGYSIILDSREHDRTILTYKGINDELSLEEFDYKILETNWLYFSSLLGKSFETQKRLAKFFINKGAKLAFNPSEYLIKNYNINEILRLTSILILNKEEAQLLTREKDLLSGLNKLGSKTVVITNKDKLISCYDGKKKYFLKPHKIKVVERTGAGDAFASGFVAGFMKNKPILECLKFGLKESESVIQHFGAKNNLLRSFN